MSQIAVRLTAAELAGIDRLVADHRYGSRAAVVREALGRLQKAERDREIAGQYERAYADVPPTEEDAGWAWAGAAALAELTQDEPPWDFGTGDAATPGTPPVALDRIEAVTRELLGLVQVAADQRRRAS